MAVMSLWPALGGDRKAILQAGKGKIRDKIASGLFSSLHLHALVT